jgi:diguanylate cyclase (GGDEF)-like protein
MTFGSSMPSPSESTPQTSLDEADSALWSKRANQAIHQLTGTGYALIDETLTLRWANDSGCRLIGTNPVGRSIVDFIHPDDLAFAAEVLNYHQEDPESRNSEHFAADEETTRPSSAVRLRRNDGTYRTCTVRVENRLDDPLISAIILRVDFDPDRSGVGACLELITAGAPIAEVAACLAKFIPHEFDRKLTHCLGFWWAHEGRRSGIANNTDLPSELLAMVSNPCIDPLPADDGKCLPTPLEELPHILPEMLVALRARRFTHLWRIPIFSSEDHLLGTIFILGTDSYNIQLQAEVNLSIGANLFRLALVDADRRSTLTAAAITDLLSTLRNRRGLSDFLEQLPDSHFPLTALLLDLDHFKSINDLHGHATGDAVIAATGSRLAALCGPSDIAARLGGDEFVVMIAANFGPTGMRTPPNVEELVAAVSKPIVVTGTEIPIAASAGMAIAYDRSEFRDLLERADRSLYEAKSRRATKPLPKASLQFVR